MKVRNNSDLPFLGDREKAIKIFDLFYGMNDEIRIGIPKIIKKLNLDTEQSATNKVANNLMLAVCKYQEGIKASNTFSYEEIKKYYEKHKEEMADYKKQIYLKYFNKVEKSCKLNSMTQSVNKVILYDLLKDSNPNIYTLDNMDKDTVIHIIKKHSKLLAETIKKELMAIYKIIPREFMNGKEINHVYKIFNTVDEKLQEKGF